MQYRVLRQIPAPVCAVLIWQYLRADYPEWLALSAGLVLGVLAGRVIVAAWRWIGTE